MTGHALARALMVPHPQGANLYRNQGTTNSMMLYDLPPCPESRGKIMPGTCRSGYSEPSAFQCLTVFELCRPVSVKKLITRPITISGAIYRIIGDAYRISATDNTSTTKIRKNCITVLPATNICRIKYSGTLTIRLYNTVVNSYNCVIDNH